MLGEKSLTESGWAVVPLAVAAPHVVGRAGLVGDHAGEDAAVVDFGLVGDDPLYWESVRDELDGKLLEGEGAL